jgi:pyridoxamine 5'-phosphate oxidase
MKKSELRQIYLSRQKAISQEDRVSKSEAIADRPWLEARWAELTASHGDSPPRPPHWGGYRIVPDYLEFWQGRLSRLHDRIAYSRAQGPWKIARLAP